VRREAAVRGGGADGVGGGGGGGGWGGGGGIGLRRGAVGWGGGWGGGVGGGVGGGGGVGWLNALRSGIFNMRFGEANGVTKNSLLAMSP